MNNPTTGLSMPTRFDLAKIAFEIYSSESTIEETVLTIRNANYLDKLYPCLRMREENSPMPQMNTPWFRQSNDGVTLINADGWITIDPATLNEVLDETDSLEATQELLRVIPRRALLDAMMLKRNDNIAAELARRGGAM